MFSTQKHISRWAVLVCLVVMTTLASAQLPMPVSTAFDITGFLQAATLNNAADSKSGGTLTVNGHVITVPSNLIVILPANALTWQELFAKAPAPYGLQVGGNGQSGLAMSDTPTPLTTWEVHVVGNRVTSAAGGDQYIAGLIDIAQNGLNSGQGFINFIDYATGEMRVGGTIGDATTGARVRINDPMGRYGLATTSPDVRFTVDPDNPTIMSGTGYPMCVPRGSQTGDPQCPQLNRPVDITGNFAASFTTANLTSTCGGTCVPLPAGTFPDSTLQAPLEVGDYVTYSGTLVQDCATCAGGGTIAGPYPLTGAAATWISAHTIVNNVAIYTFPGSNPAYIETDVFLMGTGGLTVLGAGEAAIRTRFEGMMTDPSRSIHLYGIDLDPTTGATSDRDWGTIGVDQGPPTGAVKGRWRFRPPCANFGTDPATIKFDKQCIYGPTGTFLPPTREMRSVIEGLQSQNPASATAVTAANGLFYGQYHAPILEYIFPENIPGSPIVANNFEAIPFLAQGGYTSSGIPDGVSTLVGQLNPWPGAVAPATNSAPTSVTVTASPLTVASGGTVVLSASSNGSPAPTIAWSTSGGLLSAAAGASVSLTAPVNTTASPISVTVTATASNGLGSASGTAVITVNPAPQLTAAITPAAPQTVASGTPVTLTASCTGGTQPCTFNWVQTSGPNVGLTQNATTGVASFTLTLPLGTTSPAVIGLTVTATDAAAGTASASTTVTVNPPADSIAVTSAEYRTGKQRLIVNASSSVISPGVVLTLQPYLTEAGTTYDPNPVNGGVGNVFTNNGGGLYIIDMVGAPAPACNLGGTYATPCSQKPIVVKSNLGGTSLPTALTRIRN